MVDLKRLRKDKKLTQTDLAFILGCGQPNVVHIEKNERALTKNQMELLKERFGDLDKYTTDNNINYNYDDNNSYNINKQNIDEIIAHWSDLVNKQQKSIDKLLNLLEKEKEEKSNLIQSINSLTNILAEKKAV